MTTALTKEQTKAYGMIPEVKANHRECIKSGKETLKYAMQAGDLLNKMKPLVKHGEWEDIVDKCGFEVRIAQGYMKLARELPKLVGPEALSELGIRGGLKLIADYKKGGDQEPSKTKRVSLLKSTSAAEKSTSENGKKPDPPKSSGDQEPPKEAEHPNECAPGKHKWGDDGNCEKCYVAKAVAEPTKTGKIDGGTAFPVDQIEAASAADEAKKPKTPQAVMEAVQAEYDQCLEHLKQSKRVFNVLAGAERSGPWLVDKRTRIVAAMEEIRDALTAIRPGGLCTKCKGKGCEFCHKTGHLTGSYVRSRT